MAVGHYNIGLGSHSNLLKGALTALEQAYEGMKDVIAVGPQMIDGDGSDAAHFTYFAEKFGFATNAIAKAAWEEFQSLYSKFSGDGSVSNVNAAMLQAFAKFR